MKQLYKVSVLAAAMGLLGACSTTFDPEFGSSVEHNMRVQTVNHDPGYQSTIATLEGQKAEKLLEDYRGEEPEAQEESLTQAIGD